MTPSNPIETPPPPFPAPLYGALPPAPWPTVSKRGGGWRPPADVAQLHLPGVAEGLWLRLLGAVRNPVRVLEGPGPAPRLRLVQILGCALLRIRPEGRVECLLLQRSEQELGFIRVHEHAFALLPIPWGWAWLDVLRQAAELELANIFEQLKLPATPAQLTRYARALFAHFRRRLARHADLRWMRRRVAATLKLDPVATRLACRLMDLPTCASTPRLGDYNSALRHKAALLQLEPTLPQLIPLYTALANDLDFPAMLAPLEALRTVLARRGLRPSTWRLLLSASPRLLLPVRHFYRGDAGEAMLDYLHILQSMRLRREPPAWLMWALLSQAANPAQRLQRLHPELADALPAVGHALRALQARPAGSVPRADALRVLDWLGQTPPPTLDKAQRRAGWPWLNRAAQAWAAEQEAALDDTPWPTPVESVAGLGYWGEPLRTRLALWREAQAMHHCVDRFADACAAGDALVLSITHLKRPTHRVATALLKRHGRAWSLAQLRGFANRDPQPEVARAAALMVHHLNAAMHFGRIEAWRAGGAGHRAASGTGGQAAQDKSSEEG